MEANELRIGNYGEKDGVIYKVHEIYRDALVIAFPLDGRTSPIIDNIKPIPLTEEWLVNLGFELVNDKMFLLMLGSREFTIRKKREICFEFYSDTQWITDLNYVHQLQNLYFALTGEELTINK